MKLHQLDLCEQGEQTFVRWEIISLYLRLCMTVIKTTVSGKTPRDSLPWCVVTLIVLRSKWPLQNFCSMGSNICIELSSGCTFWINKSVYRFKNKKRRLYFYVVKTYFVPYQNSEHLCSSQNSSWLSSLTETLYKLSRLRLHVTRFQFYGKWNFRSLANV